MDRPLPDQQYAGDTNTADELEITGHLEGYALRLGGEVIEVLEVGTLTHVTRARIAYRIEINRAMHWLNRIVRIEGLHNQRKAA